METLVTRYRLKITVNMLKPHIHGSKTTKIFLMAKNMVTTLVEQWMT